MWFFFLKKYLSLPITYIEDKIIFLYFILYYSLLTRYDTKIIIPSCTLQPDIIISLSCFFSFIFSNYFYLFCSETTTMI